MFPDLKTPPFHIRGKLYARAKGLLTNSLSAMTIPQHRETPVFTLAAFLLCLILFSGCDTFSNESEERVPGRLTATFAETDSVGRFVATIDSFEVDRPPAVSLDRTLQVSIGPEVFGSAILRLDNASSNAVVFFFGVDPSTGNIVTPSRAVSAPSNVFVGSARAESLASNVRLYAFFVEGVGEAPSEPLGLSIEPTEDSADTIELKLDPSQHTLPARYALHIDEDDLGALPPAGYVSVRLENGTETELQPGDPHVVLASRRSTGESNDWGGAVIRGGVQAGYSAEGQVSDFEYIVAVLD